MLGGALLLAVLAASDGSELPWSSRYDVANWAVAEGLPQTSITAIAQDERGFLWLTTFGGLVRFDGDTFERFGVGMGEAGGQRFTAVTCTGSTVWVGTQDGALFRLDDWGRAAPVRIPLGQGVSEPIWQLTARRGGVLVAAGHGGTFSVGETVTKLDPGSALRVVETPRGAVWVLRSDRIACVAGCAPGTAVPIRTPGDLWLELDGNVGVSNAEGLFVVQPEGLVHRAHWPISRGLFDGAASRRWLTVGFGLLAQTPERTERVFLPPPRGQSKPGDDWRTTVHVLFVDRQGTLWVGTDNAGLFRVRDRHLHHVALPDDTPASAALTAPVADGGALVAGYCGGLLSLASDEATLTRVKAVERDACIFSLTPARDGSTWVGRAGVLSRFDGATFTTLFESDPAPEDERPEFKVVLELGADVWLGTSQGLWQLQWRGAALTRVHSFTRHEGLPGDLVVALAPGADGGLLVGTTRGIASLVDGRVERFLRESDDRAAIVRDIVVEPSGAVWLATYGEGLAYVEPGRGRRAAHWFGTAEGFFSNELSRLIPLDGQWWINSNSGLYRVSDASLRAFVRGEAPLAGQLLLSGEGNGGGHHAGGLLSSGGLAFPTVEGVALVRPSEVPALQPPPNVFIERATLGGQPVLEGHVTSSPAHRNFEVRLSTPPDAFRSGPLRVLQTLKLDGVVAHETTGGLEARYVELDPGAWTFEVRPEGISKTLPPSATLHFTIAPRFWERTSSRLALATVLVLAVLGAFRVLASRNRALAQALEARERSAAAQRERDEVYKTLFDGSPAPLLTFQSGALVSLNPAAIALLEAPGIPVSLPIADPVEAARFARWLDVPEPAELELSLFTSTAKLRVVRVKQARLGADASRVVVAAVDVTAEREAAREREAMLTRTTNAQRLEALGRLAAGVAHDFNNVLAALQLELEEVRKLPGSQAIVAEMQEGLDAGRRLTRRFLVFGKESSADVIALDEGLRRVHPMLVRLLLPDVVLELSCETAGASVQLGAGHLDQVLLNLVVNAQEAMGARGTIRVKTRRLDAPPAGHVVVPCGQGPFVELAVSDTGKGMEPQTLSRAFEPFFTTKEHGKGTGMGLAVVHGIATRAQAGIVVSTSEAGTTISLLFPVRQDAAPLAMSAPAPRQTAFTGRVLICEDTAPLRRALVRLFSGAGFEVVDVENGALGLQTFSEQSFQLVVTDLVMPELNGAQLIQAIRRSGSRVPIIMASGYPTDAMQQLDEASRAGVKSIEKPWESDALLSLARSLLTAS